MEDDNPVQLPIDNLKQRMKDRKAFEKTLASWTKKAKKENKIICQTCVSQDKGMGRLKGYEEYANREYKFLKFGEKEYPGTGGQYMVVSKWLDYECPRGHGITIFKRPLRRTLKDESTVGVND